MNKDIKALWVAKLRSGEYKQGTGLLRASAERFCCLGVLCDIHRDHAPVEERENWKRSGIGYAYMNTSGLSPSVVNIWAGLSRDDAGALANMNDKGKTFGEIAAYIEENL